MSSQTDAHQSSATALTAVFGDDAKTRVLDTLAGTGWVSTERVVDETGNDRDVLQLALVDLERMGVIRTATSAGRREWRLNAEGQLGQHIDRIVQEVRA